MKVSAVLAVVFAAVAHANVEYAEYADAEQLDIGNLLQSFGGKGLGGLIKQITCGLPCVTKGANQIKNTNVGLVDAACQNIDKIHKYAAGCLKQCHIPVPEINKGVQLAKQVCKKGL
ncbi:hypothetical protein G6O67_007532 [Ophiocordyceps sinensis]|uniref:Cell wall protein n=2 Tax=Ophiocordyceps sinensis TaxID=72228 RepID=A0A8H4PLS3_9HYPO|nr:hypothetical protein OCS_06880 [Ophiocordyceps sinensis CO18]KAF4505601.1 hypothetical protein G6O67_007532 [Ophiocordyceps sinensis]